MLGIKYSTTSRAACCHAQNSYLVKCGLFRHRKRGEAPSIFTRWDLYVPQERASHLFLTTEVAEFGDGFDTIVRPLKPAPRRVKTKGLHCFRGRSPAFRRINPPPQAGGRLLRVRLSALAGSEVQRMTAANGSSRSDTSNRCSEGPGRFARFPGSGRTRLFRRTARGRDEVLKIGHLVDQLIKSRRYRFRVFPDQFIGIAVGRIGWKIK
jgi:hypothetical protein